jgi:glycosyltransferase involved in cell wall biosynthesis
MQSVSVVIPNLNSTHIAHTIESVLDQNSKDPAIEIIVVGLDEHNLIPSHENVRFISTGQPVSAARARNIGYAAAQGDIICFIDADCLAMPGWLERLTRWLEQGYTVVGGAIDFAGANYWGVCDNIVSLFPFLTFMPAGKRAYLPSLNLAILHQVLSNVGGFDERFPGAAGEDVDLSFRLRRLGHKLYFDPQAVVRHCHGRLSAKAVWQHMFHFGQVWIPLRMRFPDMKSPSVRVQLSQRIPYLFLASTPGVAIFETIGLFLRTPRLLRYWYTTPGLIWCEMAWCAGAAQAMICSTGV